VSWFRKAADASEATAMNNLGVLYSRRGVPKDEAQAVSWFRKAADVVNPKAETREKGHNGAERCIPSLSRIDRRGKEAVPGSMTRSFVGPHWNG